MVLASAGGVPDSRETSGCRPGGRPHLRTRHAAGPAACARRRQAPCFAEVEVNRPSRGGGGGGGAGMRAKLALCVLGLGVLGNAGCTLFGTGARVVVTRTCQAIDDCVEHRRNRKWADEAWRGVCSAGPGAPFSPDYER